MTTRLSVRVHGTDPITEVGVASQMRGRPEVRVLGPAGFTTREVDVLRLLADGCDTADIAAQLAYSERTIKNIIHDLISRLQLRNRSHAVAFAVRAGVI